MHMPNNNHFLLMLYAERDKLAYDIIEFWYASAKNKKTKVVKRALFLISMYY